LDKIISYKRYLNKEFLNSNRTDNFLNELIKNKMHFWSTTGRNGLIILFDLLEFKEGDKILIPAFVAHGIVLPIKKKGIKPIFYKSDENLNPDLFDIENNIKKDNKIVAIFFIHYFGFPQETERILKLSSKYNLISIEDCAQALFSNYSKDNLIGTKGDITLYSLSKFLPIPDGSLFVVNNSDLKLDLNNIKYKNTFISWLSVKLAMLQLLINSKLSKNKSYLVSIPLEVIYKLITPIHYFLICFENNHVNISSYSKRLLEKIDIKKMIDRRKRNLSIIYKKLKINEHYFYRKYKDIYCLTGVPLKFRDRNKVVNELKKKNIKPLIYNKFWWFLPKKKNQIYKNQYKIFHDHLLLPINENIKEFQLNYISKVLNNIVKNKT
jgi:dTDP-4-amino-4,6-dideoxygalactose transaminase